jgi:uncharacterized protein YqeY
MSLLQKLDNDLKTSLKTSDRLRVSVLRLAKAAIKNKEIEQRGVLSDDDILTVLYSLSKQRRESIEQFSKGGREDLAEQERQELLILQSYMPRQLSSAEIDSMIIESIQESSAAGIKDMSKVLRILMPRIKGIADGKFVSQRVKELLEQ